MNATDSLSSVVYLTLAQAAQQLPGKAAPSSIWRWYARGVNGGVRLRTIKVGKTRYTTAAWLAEFIEQSTAAADAKLLSSSSAERLASSGVL